MTSHPLIDPDRLAAADRLYQTGQLTDDAWIAWALAESGIATHREIARIQGRSKGTVTEKIDRARRLIDQAIAEQEDTQRG